MTESIDTSWRTSVKRPIALVSLFCIAFSSLVCEPVQSYEFCCIFGGIALAASGILARKFEMPPSTGNRSCSFSPVLEFEASRDRLGKFRAA